MHRVARLASSLMLLALCLLPRAASAQFDNRAWTTYLHAETCQDLLCTGDTVWVATGEAGLLRYVRSSQAWSSITREPSGLAGNSLQCLVFDAEGRLFVSVPGKGVSRLDNDGRWSLINEFDGLPSDSALVMRAQGDTVWIGTTRGLALWNGTTLAGSIPDRGTVSPFGSDQMNGIGFTGDTMFVATPVGVYIARKSQLLRPWTQINAGLPLNPNVTSLATDGHTVTVVAEGTNSSGGDVHSSFTWLPGSGAWGGDFPTGTNGNPSVRRVRDDNGIILCTTVLSPTINGGVYRRRGIGDWELSPGSPATDRDDNVGLEVGAAPNGVVFGFSRGTLKASPDWTPVTPPGPTGNYAVAIFWQDGAVYVNYFNRNGSTPSGVSRLRDGVWRNWPGSVQCTTNCDTTFTNSNFPMGSLADPNGTKWIGVWGGPLAHFDDSVDPPRFQNLVFNSASGDTVHLHSCVWSSAVDSNTAVGERGRWFGLDTDSRGDPAHNPQGIDLYDAAGNFVRNFPPSYPNLRNGQVRALAIDKDNVMWVGYAKNVTAGISTFPVPDTIGKDIALSDVDASNTKVIDCFGIQIYGDSVWVQGDDGLRRFDRIGRRLVTQLDVAGPPAPLGATHPLAVAADGSVFVGTSAGLRWHRRGVAAVDYTPDNSPIADIEVRAVWVDPSGAVWVATATGINRFDPHFTPPPTPVLPSLSVTVYPNPAWRTRAGFELKMRGEATHYEGEIYDINGRLVHRFVQDGNDRVMWNGFDMDGRGVGAGVYFMKVRGGGASATTRIVVLR